MSFAPGREHGRLSNARSQSPSNPNGGASITWGGRRDEGRNYAVSNDGLYFPRASASYTGPDSSAAKLIDGNYWYHTSPPNRWTCVGSPNKTDWCAIDFGVKRHIDRVKLYVLDDGAKIRPPAKIRLEYWDGRAKAWNRVPLPYDGETLPAPDGHRPYVIRFPAEYTEKVRALLTHREGAWSGLSEFEAWGVLWPDEVGKRTEPAPMPAGNLAYNPGGKPFPKVSASYTSRFDKVEFANDGKVNFHPSPNNRWTSYESPNATDWLEIDFGEPKESRRLELAIFDDRGGVRAPQAYDVQYWDGSAWKSAANQRRSPEKPAGGQFNEVTFDPVTASKVRVVFTHQGKARSGVSEIFVWKE